MTELLESDGSDSEVVRSGRRHQFLALFDGASVCGEEDAARDDVHPAVRFVHMLSHTPKEVKKVVNDVGEWAQGAAAMGTLIFWAIARHT